MGKCNVRKKTYAVILAIFIILCSKSTVYAADGSLLQMAVDDEKVVSYVACDSNVDSVDVQIAQYPCGQVAVVPPEDILIHTVILLDNSLSISEDNRGKIKDILRQYVQELPENETVSLATFGEDINFLARKSQDAEEMTQLIDAIEFQDQDTYLTDYLFQVLEEIEKDPEYTRFIVISDGVDNKAIGITKEELIVKLKETSRQINTIGHIYGDNASQLKNMFALSRATAGDEFLIEDVEDIGAIAEKIHDCSDIFCVKADIPQNLMDGADRHILLNIHTGEGDIEVTGELAMPFTVIDEEPEKEEEPTPNPTLEPTPKPTPVPKPTPEIVSEEKPTGSRGRTIIGVVLLAAALFVLLLYQRKRNHKKEPPENQEIPAQDKSVAQKVIVEKNETEEETMILDGRYLLVLRDRSKPERIFRYPLDGHVIVGRNIDMVQIPIDYNLTVSGQHCEFYSRNNRFFIRDMNSVNHTYVEGKMITGESEIVSGSIVKLGEVEFCVEIMPI